MNLTAIESILYDTLSLNTTPPAGDIRRLRGYVNLTNRKIMGKRQSAKYRRRTIPFIAAASSIYTAIPQSLTRIFTVVDQTNDRRLDPMALGDLRAVDPGNIYSSTAPTHYTLITHSSPVVSLPAITGEEIFIKSTAAGDGAAVTAALEGQTVLGGAYRVAAVAMNGTTAVSFGVGDWIMPMRLSLYATTGGAAVAATGYITLHLASGSGTEIARIAPGRYGARYTVIRLYPYPSSQITLYADAELHVEDLTHGGDEPLIPEDFHDLYVDGALMREYDKKEKDALYARAKARYDQKWREFCLFSAELDQPTGTPPGSNNLTGMFAAD